MDTTALHSLFCSCRSSNPWLASCHIVTLPWTLKKKSDFPVQT